MRLCRYILCIVSLIFLASPVQAQDTDPVPTPTQPPQQTVSTEWINQFETDDNASDSVEQLVNFIGVFDSFLGGIIFQTPNIMNNEASVTDDITIAGLSEFREISMGLSIPILAIVIGWMAMGIINNGDEHAWRSFLTRLMVVVAIYVFTPAILSYSITASNHLCDLFKQGDTFGSFLMDYYAEVNEDNAAQMGIPNISISLTDGILKSLTKSFIEMIIKGITIVFLLLGLLFIAFQFIQRFAALLFLSIIFPFVIPFGLSPKTENITNSFFRTWFTYLIHQPAFVLGYTIATRIARSAIESAQLNIGILLLYIGFLFFLGSVSTLAARIFGDTWTTLSNNIQAGIASGGLMASTVGMARSTASKMKQGAVSGRAYGLREYVGMKLGRRFAGTQSSTSMPTREVAASTGAGGAGKSSGAVPPGREIITKEAARRSSGSSPSATAARMSRYRQEVAHKGLSTTVENPRMGIVRVSGDAYQYRNAKTGLTSVYINKEDAKTDGVAEDRLSKVRLNNQRYVDLSMFNKKYPNPHNAYATKMAKERGEKSNFAHVTASSSPDRVKNHLELNKEPYQSHGIDGLMVKRYGSPKSKEKVLRFYTDKPLS